MKTKLLALIIAFTCVAQSASAQYWPGDHWYDNPLGFDPVKLHTSMGFLIPAAAVGTCLLLTQKNENLKERLSVYNESGFSWGYKYPYTFMAQNNTGFNLMLRKFMSVGAEFDLYFPTDQYNKTTGFAFRPFARFYMINNTKWRVYFESGGGLVYFTDYFPLPTEQDDRLGTQLNGTTKYGIGSEINITPETGIVFGVRHLHVSNGNTKGAERNPSHDSNGFFIGFNYHLSKN